jgi:hypothetical protein
MKGLDKANQVASILAHSVKNIPTRSAIPIGDTMSQAGALKIPLLIWRSRSRVL